MKIPSKINVAGKTYKIKWDNKNELPGRSLVGEVDYATCVIVISKKDQNSIQTRETIEHIFLHEIWHVIWNALGDLKLRKDEQKADAFCGLLQQVLNSGKGDLK